MLIYIYRIILQNIVLNRNNKRSPHVLLPITDHPPIGDIPSGLPSFATPLMANTHTYLTDAILIAVLSFVISISMAKMFAAKNKYTIDADQVGVATVLLTTVCECLVVLYRILILTTTTVYMCVYVVSLWCCFMVCVCCSYAVNKICTQIYTILYIYIYIYIYIYNIYH